MARIWKTLFALALLTLSACHSTQSRETYSIGYDPSFYPLQIGGQQKNVLAFSVELLVEIAKIERLQLAIIEMNSDNLIWGLQHEKYDAALSPQRSYAYNETLYNFSHLLLKTGPVLVAPINSSLSKKNLKGKEVTVVQGSEAASTLQAAPGVILRPVDTVSLALLATDAGIVDAAAVPVLMAEHYVRDIYPKELKIVSAPLTDEGLRLLTMYKLHPGLIKRIDHGLAKLQKSGMYDKLLRKWGLSFKGEPVPNLDAKLTALLESLNP